jgi:hypothetical protein
MPGTFHLLIIAQNHVFLKVYTHILPLTAQLSTPLNIVGLIVCFFICFTLKYVLWWKWHGVAEETVCGGNDIDRQLPIKNYFSNALCGEPEQNNKQQH